MRTQLTVIEAVACVADWVARFTAVTVSVCAPWLSRPAEKQTDFEKVAFGRERHGERSRCRRPQRAADEDGQALARAQTFFTVAVCVTV